MNAQPPSGSASRRKLLRHPLAAVALSTMLGWMAPGFLSAQTTNQLPADAWATNTAPFPAGVATNLVQQSFFTGLHVEIIAGKVKVVWPKGDLPETSTVRLTASADDLGHWPARDWRTYPMTRRGINWEATPPVDNVDIPLLFYITASNSALSTVSPLRLCRPRAAGLEEPSRVFWPFLEGFEESLESWRLIDAGHAAAPLKKGLPAKNGKAALAVELAAGSHSVTLATTKARGWQIEEKAATGLRIWLRTKSGAGAARFTLLANAFATNQVVSQFPADLPLSDQWQKFDLPFYSFPKLPLGDIDLFTIEFTGDGPVVFLADDLQLLGGWRLLGD